MTTLLVELGQIQPATLQENLEVMGLVGRRAVTVERLLRSEWRLWREAGVVSTPPPEPLPIATGVIAELAREQPASFQSAPVGDAGSRAGGDKATTAGDATSAPTVLLAHIEPSVSLDERRLVADIGWAAGVFERSPIRVSTGARSTTERVESLASEEFALAPARLVVGDAPAAELPGVASTVLEILVAP